MDRGTFAQRRDEDAARMSQIFDDPDAPPPLPRLALPPPPAAATSSGATTPVSAQNAPLPQAGGHEAWLDQDPGVHPHNELMYADGGSTNIHHQQGPDNEMIHSQTVRSIHDSEHCAHAGCASMPQLSCWWCSQEAASAGSPSLATLRSTADETSLGARPVPAERARNVPGTATMARQWSHRPVHGANSARGHRSQESPFDMQGTPGSTSAGNEGSTTAGHTVTGSSSVPQLSMHGDRFLGKRLPTSVKPWRQVATCDQFGAVPWPPPPLPPVSSELRLRLEVLEAKRDAQTRSEAGYERHVARLQGELRSAETAAGKCSLLEEQVKHLQSREQTWRSRIDALEEASVSERRETARMRTQADQLQAESRAERGLREQAQERHREMDVLHEQLQNEVRKLHANLASERVARQELEAQHMETERRCRDAIVEVDKLRRQHSDLISQHREDAEASETRARELSLKIQGESDVQMREAMTRQRQLDAEVKELRLSEAALKREIEALRLERDRAMEDLTRERDNAELDRARSAAELLRVTGERDVVRAEREQAVAERDLLQARLSLQNNAQSSTLTTRNVLRKQEVQRFSGVDRTLSVPTDGGDDEYIHIDLQDDGASSIADLGDVGSRRGSR